MVTGSLPARRRFVFALMGLALALTLFTSLSPQPAGAYRAVSVTCNVIESGFNQASDLAISALDRGDQSGYNTLANVSLGLQHLWLIIDRGDGSPNEAV
jgi:hypothetical protein